MDELTALSAKSLEKRERRDRKNVIFSGDAGESDDEDNLKSAVPLFPKAKKRKDKLTGSEDSQGASVLETPDPRVAALARASRRKEEMDTDDTDLLEDVEGAEEEFIVGEEEEASTIEPFNLNKERQEGYFDGDGNYVEYKVDKTISDAWLDSVQVDERFAEVAAARAAEADEQPSELTSAELGAMKRRIADSLLPEETILQGLKRLGGTRERSTRGKWGGREKPKTATAHSAVVKMDPEHQRMFDQLTEDAMKLLENGEFGVYSEKRETFLREAEGYEALMKARQSSSTAGKRSLDMFVDSDDEDAVKADTESMPAAKRTATSAGNVSGMEASDQEVHTATTDQTVTGTNSDEFGYVYDSGSGYYYNSDTGYYYDPASGLYCSAETGVWYHYNESNLFVPVNEATGSLKQTNNDNL